ncbi:MAG: carboxy-S-adenosyl-L-methionine synthase CmoA [Caldithrix sp.]|nr:carboxy-S-adenosyl-L-methionine synthase CmoA [Caldithrix sp.]
MAGYVFDDAVAEVFPDMIKRSAPGYQGIIDYMPVFAERFVQTNTLCYDLGCSLGASAFSLIKGFPDRSVKVIAVDNSKSMIQRLNQTLKKEKPSSVILPVCSNLTDIRITNASVIILNFTLQFLHPQERSSLLHRLYLGLIDGGVLILSEKIRFADDRHQNLQTDLHHTFKRQQGYSDLEISQKRTALENVLLPETVDDHLKRLKESGFCIAAQWFQNFNFVSFYAVK